ncbi:MAG: flagellar basal body rod protein FlgB [Lachnospiraceae bacterium]|jgi:flagellar basal-body rod protein FlgB|nr:flagellar basal body rod protein FlgB [Lachnospiraceae bacterium]
MAGLYGNGIELTERMLDFLWGRQNLTLNNIANVDTPGYKTRYMTFEAELQERLQNASQGRRPKVEVSQAIGQTHAAVHVTRSESTRLDGNNVDMDQEQVELVRTAYEYQYMLNSINSEFKRLQSAARQF